MGKGCVEEEGVGVVCVEEEGMGVVCVGGGGGCGMCGEGVGVVCVGGGVGVVCEGWELTTGMRNWMVQDLFPRHVVFSSMNPLTDLNTSSALFRHQLMVIS